MSDIPLLLEDGINIYHISKNGSFIARCFNYRLLNCSFPSSISCLIFFATFADLDECQSPDACGANHVCNNTIGSHRCECPNGFVADSGAQDPLNPVCIGKKYIKLFYADTY